MLKLSIDALTALPNCESMLKRLNEEAKSSSRTGKTFSLAIFDIDDFKNVNELYGYEFGDQVLINIASILKTNVRKVDLVSRWGGEEFLLLFSESTNEEASIVCKRIKNLIAISSVDCDGQRISVTATFGVSDFFEFPGVEEMIDSAEMALEQGKACGKNRVVMA